MVNDYPRPGGIGEKLTQVGQVWLGLFTYLLQLPATFREDLRTIFGEASVFDGHGDLRTWFVTLCCRS